MASVRTGSGLAVAAALLLVVGATAAGAATVPAASVAGPPAASAAAIPDDVAAFFAEQASGVLQGSGLPGEPRGIHEVFTWSEAYLVGEGGAPTASLDEWIAAVEREGEPIGTLTAWRPSPGAPAEFAATSDDAGLAAALLAVPAGATLVSDPPIDAWYALVGETLTPLDEHAAAELPQGRATLAELQPSVVERTAAARAAGGDASVDGGGRDAPLGAQPWMLGAGIIAAVIGALAIVAIVRRVRRRRAE